MCIVVLHTQNTVVFLHTDLTMTLNTVSMPHTHSAHTLLLAAAAALDLVTRDATVLVLF